ncbi:globin-like protein [Ascoidea rubescens DSM 1968]|uniref:Globin-like protein n=1 Tax=Ascoidea rubescens DSM 1968 TaxID=1344418 RepID=A0A1D2VHQ4_9ASCO|nr:globin-like protein [Ascoidea rubescens DSM 1968]ODV61070.1 globin-like protein [Ascoidea rubescens DSM 1968]
MLSSVDTNLFDQVSDLTAVMSISSSYNSYNNNNNNNYSTNSKHFTSIANMLEKQYSSSTETFISSSETNTVNDNSFNTFISQEKLVLRLTPHEINMIRNSWALVLSDNDSDISDDEDDNEDRLYQKIHRNQKSKSSVNPTNNDNNSNRSFGPKIKAMASSLFCLQFYQNLLSMDPELERIYPSIKHQAVAFSGVLGTAITTLENLSVLDDYLIQLGRRHARILCIEPSHFELMGEAFLKTLQDRFGVAFSVELEDVWARLYSYLANTMLQGGDDPVIKFDDNNNQIDLFSLKPYTTALSSQSQPLLNGNSIPHSISSPTSINSPFIYTINTNDFIEPSSSHIINFNEPITPTFANNIEFGLRRPTQDLYIPTNDHQEINILRENNNNINININAKENNLNKFATNFVHTFKSKKNSNNPINNENNENGNLNEQQIKEEYLQPNNNIKNIPRSMFNSFHKRSLLRKRLVLA